MEKIIFVDHSFHKKTKSSDFIVNILKERYLVDIVWDEYWENGKIPDLSFVDDSYFAVVFWQTLIPEYLHDLKCKNIIYFPMYDFCCDKDIDYWYGIRNVKVISFCRKIYEYLDNNKFVVKYIQYYDKQQECDFNNELSIFFWYRTNDITWNTVKKLIQNLNIKSIHIHAAIDPYNVFVKPSLEDEKKYNITYSSWFESKEEYYKCMKSKSIYIAPRKTEGIGFSFIEAMSMGKIVFAANNPTMNEYITDGVNGFLFDDSNPKPIKSFNINKLYSRTLESVDNGYKVWIKQRDSIFSIIELEPRDNDYFYSKYRKVQNVYKLKNKAKSIAKYIVPYGFVYIYKKIYKK